MRSVQRPRGGFTLVEVALTILIVGLGLVLILQGLNKVKMTAAHTANLKQARELGLLTLGRIEAGYYTDDLYDIPASYAEDGRPDFYLEVLLGDESFIESDTEGRFDYWADQRERELERRDRENRLDDDPVESDEEVREPYERVQIKITFPKIQEYKNELILERWIPWDQVYGPPEDEELGVPEETENG